MTPQQGSVIAVGVVVAATFMGFYNKPVITTDAKPVQTAVSGLTASDLRGTVRLNASQRQHYVETCAARVATLDMSRRGTVRIVGSIRDLKNERMAATTRICDCLVDQVENRANGLQLRMFMSVLAGGRGTPLMSMPDHRQYWDFATANGLSPAEFKELTVDLGKSIARSAEICQVALDGSGWEERWSKGEALGQELSDRRDVAGIATYLKSCVAALSIAVGS